MRISKLWSAVCAAAFLPGFLSVRAQDNPAQAAARAALMEKMSESNSQPGPPPAIKAQPAPPANKPMATTVPPPVERKSAFAPIPTGTPAGANDTPAQTAARAALMAKTSELNAQQPPSANPGLAPIVLSPSGAAAEQAGPPAPAMTASPPPVATKPVPAPDLPQMRPASADANDNPAQAAARAALMAKMSESNALQTQTANPVPASGVVTVTNAGQKQSDQPAKAMTTSPPPATPARATTHLASPKPAVRETNSPTASAPVRAKKAKPVATPVASTDSSGFTPVPPPSNPAGAQPAVSYPPQVKQQPAVIPPSKVTVAAPAKPVAPVAAPVVKPPPPAKANYPGKALGFPPVEAPPPPVSAQQQADLQALLARYMANQISPEEYQKERAAILARP